MKVNTRIYGVIVGLIFILFSWAQSFFVNYLIPLGLVAIVVSVINIIVVKKRMDGKLYRVLLGVSALFIVFDILWMIFDKIELFIVAQVSFVVIGFVLFVFGIGIQTKMNLSVKSITSGIIKWISIIFLIAISSVLIVLTATPKPFATFFQNYAEADNYYEAKVPSKITTIDGKYQLTNDIQYGERYPNSYLDIVTPNDQIDENRPTYFFVHGGGFVVGDKIQGDPNAPVGEDSTLYHFKKMIDHGYNVVSINYALAPDYQYPTPDKQLSEAVQFLQKNSKQYGINMKDVVFAGSSAGGYIVTDFTTIQANPEYAKEIGIEPVIQLKDIKALVLESALFDPTRGDKTEEEDPLSDYNFGQSLNAYFGEHLVSPDKETMESRNLISKATSDFPPTFISDGNTATFPDQAEDYKNRLTKLGVKTELYIPDINVSKEGHSFMANIHSKPTQTYVERKLAFLDSLD